MSKILIIKTGMSFSRLAKQRGDFEDWTISRLGIGMDEVHLVDVFKGKEPPIPDRFSGVIITGSHAMITDRKRWSELVAEWIPSVIEAEIPLLGICYGHQLIAHAMGGRVDSNPRGREFGTVSIKFLSSARSDLLFRDFPQVVRFQTCHTQSVIDLPDEATLLASNDKDPHQAFSIAKTAWGVQFHPEMDTEIVRYYIRENATSLIREGFDLEKLLETTEDTPFGEKILRRFVEIVRSR